jgi:ferredoxin-NADP reductase
MRYEVEGVVSFELRDPDGHLLPVFTAGSHIDLHVQGLVRSYSLCNTPAERHRYVIAVKRAPTSRGGSSTMHDLVRVGQMVETSAPRNNFVLCENAPHSVLIAGGIGVTPIWCMVQRLETLGRTWQLHYTARQRRGAAFIEQVLDLGASSKGGTVRVRFDQEPGVRRLDMDEIVATAPPGSHFYCCGPAGMITSFQAATAGLKREQVHIERFAFDSDHLSQQAFRVVLARSSKEVVVPTGKTILDALLEAGIVVPHSCRAGFCATCETRVLEGIPLHRDFVLSEQDRASNRLIMICCSGAKSDYLKLDL